MLCYFRDEHEFLRERVELASRKKKTIFSPPFLPYSWGMSLTAPNTLPHPHCYLRLSRYVSLTIRAPSACGITALFTSHALNFLSRGSTRNNSLCLTSSWATWQHDSLSISSTWPVTFLLSCRFMASHPWVRVK